MQEVQKGKVYVVHISPDGVPQTCDGEWTAIISVHSTPEGAEVAAQRERDSEVWGDFSHTNPDHPDYDIDNTSSDRQLWVEVDVVSLFGKAD